MIKYILCFALLIKGVYVESQTFKYPIGAIVGNQKVISIPTTITGSLSRQALLYLPDDYNKTNKKYPLFIFSHGAGEASDSRNGGICDISKLNNTALPQAISQGLKPYGIDKATGDTIKWIVISPQCVEDNACSYSFFQMYYILPYILKNYRVDLSCVWVGGLSAGGSCTWSDVMADSSFAKNFAGIMPISNGGMENWITITSYKNNLIKWFKDGGATLYLTGGADQGWNLSGGQAYMHLDTVYAQVGKQYTTIMPGYAHTSDVWNRPWALNSYVWIPGVNSWTQMWILRRNAIPITPPVPSPPPSTIPYPVRIIMKMSDSSCSVIYLRP